MVKITISSMKKWLLTVLILIIIPSVFAIGISPTSMEIPFTDNESKSVKFNVINTENHPVTVKLYSHGKIADYVSLDISEATLAPNEIKPFTASFNLPYNLSAGTYQVFIGAKSSGGNPSGTGMSTAIAAEALVYLKKLFGSGFIGLEIITNGSSSISIPVTFNLKVTNQPPDLIAKAQIYDPQGNQIGNITFPAFIDKSSKTTWKALEIGTYKVRAIANWPNGTEHAEASFLVGEPYIEIVNISILQDKDIRITNINVHARSKWNDFLNVWAEAIVLDDEKKVKDARSPQTTIDAYEDKHIRLYIGEENISKYDLEIILHYGGFSTTKRITTSHHLTEKLPRTTTSSITGALSAIIDKLEPIHVLIIVLLVVLLVLVYVYLREPKQPKYQQNYYNQYYDPYWYWRR